MDKLAKSLRDDAARISVEVSPQLEDRIRASLECTRPGTAKPPRPRRRPGSMWLASSLTGVVAAAVVIAAINLFRADSASPQAPATALVNGQAESPAPVESLDLRMRAAVLADPLAEELENLEADLRKAEDAVRRDLELIL